MRIEVPFRNPQTGQVKRVKIGWSWTLFLFAGVLGIPLFMRKLYLWGAVFLCVWLITQFAQMTLSHEDLLVLVMLFFFLLGIGLSILLAIKGNELTAKGYLDRGWQFAEPNSDATKFGKLKWGIGDSALPRI